MRSEQEMYDLILGFARGDERVRAVYLNGSRANPKAPRDKYMDFDIVYVVRDFQAFKEDQGWLDIFGERLILQMPEAMRNPCGDGRFNWMMLFADGNRLDLTLIPAERPDLIGTDSATVALLDKDGLLPDFGEASNRDYIVRRPSRLYYDSCCNNFFWCMQNVAKGLVRDELPYAMSMYNYIVGVELGDMVSWYIGVRTDFSVSAGKAGKYFKIFLPPELYERYLDVFCLCRKDCLWDGVFKACRLFRELATEVGEALGYGYNRRDDEGIMEYLGKMQGGRY